MMASISTEAISAFTDANSLESSLKRGEIPSEVGLYRKVIQKEISFSSCSEQALFSLSRSFVTSANLSCSRRTFLPNSLRTSNEDFAWLCCRSSSRTFSCSAFFLVVSSGRAFCAAESSACSLFTSAFQYSGVFEGVTARICSCKSNRLSSC